MLTLWVLAVVLRLQGDHGVLGLGRDAPPYSSLPQELPGLWEVAVTQVGLGRIVGWGLGGGV